jgi:hypothetical protein
LIFENSTCYVKFWSTKNKGQKIKC